MNLYTKPQLKYIICISKNKKHIWNHPIPRNIQYIPVFNNTILCFMDLQFNTLVLITI